MRHLSSEVTAELTDESGKKFTMAEFLWDDEGNLLQGRWPERNKYNKRSRHDGDQTCHPLDKEAVIRIKVVPSGV
jgi:hypothetical protein